MTTSAFNALMNNMVQAAQAPLDLTAGEQAQYLNLAGDMAASTQCAGGAQDVIPSGSHFLFAAAWGIIHRHRLVQGHHITLRLNVVNQLFSRFGVDGGVDGFEFIPHLGGNVV